MAPPHSRQLAALLCWAACLAVAGAAHSEEGEPSAGSGCDILLATSVQAAQRCTCDNQETIETAGNNLLAVAQLRCDDSSPELIKLLATSRVAIDYFTLNLSTPSENHQHELASTWSAPELPLQVEHMSLQLNPPHAAPRSWPQMIREQTLQLVHLINGSRLVSLTIFQERLEAPGELAGNESLELGELLSQLPKLARLQLNALPYRIHLNLSTDATSSASYPALKWLSLSSSKLFTHEMPTPNQCRQASPFASAYGLEQISLEANKLTSFPLLSMLGAPVPGENYVGLANLSSLNLASNLLGSFKEDLQLDAPLLTNVQACNSPENPAGSSLLFILPSLTQLDLSHNRLEHMTFEVGQQMLRIMPNLNHLYLQHNQIFHVNLNSLFSAQFVGPQSMYPSLNSTLSVPLPATVGGSSRLEYLDLSYNELRAITGVFEGSSRQRSHSNRFKSINLSHNYLQRPVHLIHSSYLNSILFRESFETSNFLSLESAFTLGASQNQSLSFCDFLSPSTSDEELLNEVILSDNQLTRLTGSDFFSHKCRDMQILRLQGNRIAGLEKDALLSLVNLEHFDISNNQLAIVNEQTFIGNAKLRLLNLAHNKLTHLSKETLAPLGQLEELYLQGNQLVELWNHLFVHNPLISTLNLSRNRLNSIEPFTFEPLKQLKLLSLSGNQLNAFTHLLFTNSSSWAEAMKLSSTAPPPSMAHPIKPFKSHQPNHRLRSKNQQPKQERKSQSLASEAKKRKQRQIGDSPVLVLSGNQIKVWKFDDCNSISSNAQLVWLDNNRLRAITEASFKCFSLSIQKLFLQRNHIESVEEGALRNMSQLEHLDLSWNRLITVRPRTFAGLSSLRHIDLSRNQLINFDLLSALHQPPTAMELPGQIEFISLAHNTRLDLEVADLAGFLGRQQSTLSWLQVDLSCIGSINQSNGSWNVTPLSERTSIQFLNLSSNRHLTGQFFDFLAETQLEISRLDLSNSTLNANNSQSVANLLRQQSNLAELNLSHNSEQVTLQLGELQPSLLHLDLSSSQLDSWPQMRPEVGAQLRSLNLARNRLRFLIGRHVMDNYRQLTQLDTLDLSFNALQGLVEERPGGGDGGGGTEEGKAVNLRYLAPAIRRLDLSHNRLTWIPGGFFEGLHELTSLKLNHNQLEAFQYPVTRARISVDLSFNHNLSSVIPGEDFGAQSVVAADVPLYDDHRYIVYADDSQITCESVRDFIAHNSPSTQVADEPPEVAFEAHEDGLGEQCAQLIGSTDTLSLQSSGHGHLPLARFRPRANKLAHLSFRQSALSQVEAPGPEETGAGRSVILLDLSINKLKTLPDSLCAHLSRLRSLDLSFNHFAELPGDALLACRRLTYLDLSHNRVARWAASNNATAAAAASPIQILKLAHNSLDTLVDGAWLVALARLRYIDLRGNRLSQFQAASLLQSLPLTCATSTDLIGWPEPAPMSGKPAVRLAGALLVLEVSRNQHRFTQVRVRNGQAQVEENHPLKNYSFEMPLCTLSDRHPTEICLMPSDQSPFEAVCLQSKRPRELPSCVTNLQEAHRNTESLRRPLEPEQVWPAPPKSEPDAVLNLIEHLKHTWLWVRELDLNEYLNSVASIRADSVLLVLGGGRYPVHTVTLVKLAGCCCIILLLLSLLLLATGAHAKRHTHPSSSSKAADADETCGSSNKSSGSDNSVLQTQTNSNPLCPSGSSLASRSGSSRLEESAQLETVLEKPAAPLPPLKLNAGHLLAPAAEHLLQQGSAACSTPSSSLAPSSVETAETLYAIDSIQSGYSLGNRNSVDQYAFAAPEALDLQQQQQQQHRQVATVMRMIKSNSTNFDASANFRAPTGYLGGGAAQHHYGTMYAPRQPPLYQQHHLSQCQLNPLEASNSGYGSLVYLSAPVPEESAASMMSLSAALAAASSPLDQQMSLEAQQQHQHFYQQQQPPPPPQGLCSYHRLVGASTKDAAPVIEEREEEEPAGTLGAGLPAPPQSRAIAALEEPLLFLQATSGSGASGGPR